MTNIFNQTTFHNNLDLLRRLAGLGKGEFNGLLEMGNVYRPNIRSVGAKLINAISKHYQGVNEQWLLTQHDEGPVDIIFTPSKTLGNPDFVQIKKIKTPLSGGGGTVTYYDDLGHEYAFRRDWIKKKCPHNDCALFNVSGDSMVPEISDGDIVLVDMSETTKEVIADKKIYAFSEGERIFVKRLEWRGQELWAIPSNAKEYQIKGVDQFHLIGKIIWVGHEVG